MTVLRSVLLVLAGALAVGVPLAFASEAEPPQVEAVFPDTPQWQERNYPVSDQMEGAISHFEHWIDPFTGGPSPDVGRITFDGPVEVLGVLVSVDIAPGTGLYEIVVGKNWITYEVDTTGALIQLSYDNMEGGTLDDHIWFPEPFTLEEGEWLAVAGWLFNRHPDPIVVHPEVIVFYAALSSAE